MAERARDFFSADLSYPIIMTRAYLQGERTISAIVIEDYLPPDGVVEVPQS